jgi:glycerol kinase
LLIDAYFSASKVVYLFEQDPELRRRAERGEVLFGTVDSFLIWRLTEGRCHVTDVSNASRTLMFNLHSLDWDDELLNILGIPRRMLPQVVDSSGPIGQTSLLGGSIPICGCAGDQQAATFGQACFVPGSAKNTYGTGCFMLLNTGQQPVGITSDLLATVGWKIGSQVTYCLEGSVFVGGAVVQWLRDGLGLIRNSSDIVQLASRAADSGGVYFVPAFVGLGAPHWDPYARGTIVGITRGTSAAHLAVAAIESMAFQSRDVLQAMESISGVRLQKLRVDGGAAINDRLMQFQSDILDVPVDRPAVLETTALGAAYLAGLAVGYWDSLEDVARNWQCEREFVPAMSPSERLDRCGRWDSAVQRSLRWDVPSDP